jgi:hypothetical protein
MTHAVPSSALLRHSSPADGSPGTRSHSTIVPYNIHAERVGLELHAEVRIFS